MSSSTTRPAAAPPGGGDVMAIVQSLWDSFLHGFNTAIKAIKLCANNSDVVAVHKQILIPLAFFSVVLFIGLHLAVLPFRFFCWMIRIDASKLGGYSGAITSMAPFAVAFALRFIFYSPLDRAYLSVLKDLDPILTKKLQGMTVRSWREMLIIEIKRMFWMGTFLPIVAVLRLIPGIGTLLKFGFEIYTLSKWFDPAIAVGLAVVSTFPLTEYFFTLLIQAFFSQMSTLQEIQLSYLGRVRMSRREEIKFISRQRMACLGFIVPFNLLLLVPYIGPLFCIIAHAAAPVALKELMMVDAKETEQTIAASALASPAVPTAIPVATAVPVPSPSAPPAPTAVVGDMKKNK